MNNKSLNLLRVGSLVYGWLLVAHVVMRILVPLFTPSLSLGHEAFHFHNGVFLKHYFSMFGNAFFAFLIAAVVRMIEKQSPVGKETSSRLMIVCCLSYIAEALGRFYEKIWWGFLMLQTGLVPRSSQQLSIISSPIDPIFTPILYAASIFVLYKHFIKMVTFESEVA